MLHRRVVPLLLITHCLLQVTAAVHFSRLNSRPATATVLDGTSSYHNRDTWQPRLPHNNWIILPRSVSVPGTNANPASALNVISSNRRAYMFRPHPQPHSHPQAQSSSRAPSPLLPQRLPVNYYAYNHSAGNYPQPKSDAGAVVEPSYVVAISKLKPVAADDDADDEEEEDEQEVDSVDIEAERDDGAIEPLSRHKFAMPFVSGIKMLPQDMTNNRSNNNINNNSIKSKNKHKQSHNKAHARQQQEAQQQLTAAQVILPAAQTDMSQDIEDASAEQTADDIDVKDVDEQQFNDILMPLQSALEKVKEFCDVAQQLLSDEEEDEDEIDGNESNPNHAAVSPNAAKTTSTALPSNEAASVEVQGQHHPSTTSAGAAAAARSAPALGTGRKLKKLKKKLNKILLPLLLAYKLKFLTLVPVLIGGLTLLVGTTGLAGFFFALFAAVMSLKSGGGKSLVVKKLY